MVCGVGDGGQGRQVGRRAGGASSRVIITSSFLCGQYHGCFRHASHGMRGVCYQYRSLQYACLLICPFDHALLLLSFQPLEAFLEGLL